MSNTLRPNGERQEPSWKSSNRRSTSRRRLSNGRHSAGRSAFSSFPTGSFVAVSAMSLLLTFAHLEGGLGGDADSFLFRCGVHDSPQLDGPVLHDHVDHRRELRQCLVYNRDHIRNHHLGGFHSPLRKELLSIAGEFFDLNQETRTLFHGSLAPTSARRGTEVRMRAKHVMLAAVIALPMPTVNGETLGVRPLSQNEAPAQRLCAECH